METYLSEGAALATESDFGEATVRDFLAAGFSSAVMGRTAATSRIAPLEECKDIAKRMDKAQLNHLKKIIQWVSDARKISDIIRDHRSVARQIMKRVADPGDVLFVALGSSPDKLAMVLEDSGLASITVPYSRTFFQDYDDHDDNYEKLTKKMENDFRRHVTTPIANALRESKKKRVAVVDFLYTGMSFLACFELMKRADKDVYDKAFPVIISDADVNVGIESSGRFLARSIGGSVFIHAPSAFWKFSKLSRCVPRLLGSRDIRLSGAETAACNTARIFVAACIL